MASVKPEQTKRAVRWLLGAGLASAVGMIIAAENAAAISIELTDVAADRIERQRAAVEGRLPLANTPDVARLADRLAAAGVKSGSPVLMRVFKESSELELWIEKDDRFILFATYPICHWSGTLGPKLKEGDKQTPEGFYTIASRQLRRLGRWPRAINLGFPNAFDRAHDRDGSYILMHGGCSSVGCFAMTNPVIGEVYGLTKAALAGGQRYVPIHVFPFRMSDEALAAHTANPWHGFWTTLQAGYRSFERTGRPPRISVCRGAYSIADAPPKTTDVAEPSTSKSKLGKSRSDMMLGALRSDCPDPVVVTAERRQADGDAAPVQVVKQH
jgi:murein L,D-transpeptidase YafK